MTACDCEAIDSEFPIRQGDVLKLVAPENHSSLIIVITADCDIANRKFGSSGVACIRVLPLRDYVLTDFARSLAQRKLAKRRLDMADWVNRRWLSASAGNHEISEPRIFEWFEKAPIDEIEQALGLAGEKSSFVRREGPRLQSAREVLERNDELSGIDALRALQEKPPTRASQVKALMDDLGKKDLPLDAFFVSSVPGESALGFVAQLRTLSFVPLEQCLTSLARARERVAREHDVAWVRVGRLADTIRHALAQQFGNLFARIGFPSRYESDREITFKLVADDLVHALSNDAPEGRG